MRNGVERPDQLACVNVERPHVAGFRPISFPRGRPSEEQIFEDATRSAAGSAERSKRADSHRDAAIVAECFDDLPGARVNRAKCTASGKDQAPIRSILAFPIVDPAVARAPAFRNVRPDWLSRRGVEGDYR